MEKRDKIEEEIEKTLNSLDGISGAEANPFLYTRIEARLNEQPADRSRLYGYVMAAVIILLINLFSFVIYNSKVVTVSETSVKTAPIVQEFNTFEYNNSEDK
ncbi:MAG: hypothetical protein LWX07_11395 [Bacteroidetes bacterium]|nr:hypothetical protein [Bacteroidota bacterium]